MKARVRTAFYSVDTDRESTLHLKNLVASKIMEVLAATEFSQLARDLGSIVLEVHLDFERPKAFEKST